MRTIQARYMSRKRVSHLSKVWAPIFCLFSFLWLTGCLKSLDPQLTPFISSVTPDTTTLGATIAVKGFNFSFLNAATSISLVIRGEGDTLTVDNPTIKKSESGENEIQLLLPNIPAGKYQVFLLVKDREGDRRSNEVPITILTFGPTSIEPAQGPAGTIVTIRGNGLKNTKKLLFRSANLPIEVAPLSPPTDQEVRVVVPEGAITGSIRMQLEGITLEPETAEFRVILPPPTISLLQPAKGTAGTKVVILGTNFGPVSGNDPLFSRKVTFAGPNGTRLTSTLTTVNVADSTDKKIIAIVPDGAITGPVIVEIDSVVAAQKPVFTVEVIIADKQVVWAEGSVIKVANIQKSKPVTISNFYENAEYFITAVSADQKSERLYFFGTDGTGKPFIRSVNFKGKDEKLFLSQNEPIDRLKVAGEHVYWQQENAYYRAKPTDPGSKQKVYSAPEGSSIAAFGVPATEDYIYFLEQDVNAVTDIKRRRADGTGGATTIFKTAEINNGDGSFVDLFSTTIEVAGDRLYTLVYDNQTMGLPVLFTGSTDGTGSLLGNAAFGSFIGGFAVDEKENKLYWSTTDLDTGLPSLQRGEVNGTKKEFLFKQEESFPASFFEVF